MLSPSSRIAIMLTCLMLLAACGSGDEPAADAATPSTEGSTTTQTPTTQTPTTQTPTTEAPTTTQLPTTEAPTTTAPTDTSGEGPSEPVTQSVMIGAMTTVLSPQCTVHPEFGTGSGPASFGSGALGPLDDSDPPVAITDETVLCSRDVENDTGTSYFAFATQSAGDAADLSAWFATSSCRAMAVVDSWVIVAATTRDEPADSSFLVLTDLLGGELTRNCG